MSRRPLLTAALAGAALLLGGCGGQAGQGSPAPTSAAVSSSSATSSAAAATSSAAPSSGKAEVEPVDCGEVEVYSGVKHKLIADVAAGGRVGCTEAFTVFDEFTKLPKEKRAEAALGKPAALSDGWSCTVDDGKDGGVQCQKGNRGDSRQVSLHTKPAKG